MNTVEETNIPNYGFKVKLNYSFPEKWSPHLKIKLKQVLPFIPMFFRYIIYYIKCLWQRRQPIMDYIHFVTGLQIYGVPIGGIGSGTIGRGFRGEFCRYTLRPGITEYNIIDANQFIVTIKDNNKRTIFQSLLSTFKKKTLKSWKSLIDESKCQYTGLYPRAWTEYDLSEYGIKLICRQISPVIPHEYKDSCLPCAVFVWQIENVSSEERTVTIAFTFKNGTGNKSKDREYTCRAKSFSYLDSEGIVMHHQIDKMNCSYTLATKADKSVTISKCLYIDPQSDGSKSWQQLYDNGKFDNIADKSAQSYKEMACGIAAQATIDPKQGRDLEFCLVWDMPNIHFLLNEKKYFKYYTRFFGQENASLKIVDYTFRNFRKWEKKIYEWQRPVLSDSELPDWYKGTLFNQTYYISDGGTLWLDLDEEEAKLLPSSDPRLTYGKFGFLEGAEYRMYNTYDVHFYASFALIMNWPALQLVLQYEMRDAIFMEISKKTTMLYDGKRAERKIKNTVPHDIGDPCEEPFLFVNAYNIHDVSEWRDLNVKFVLEVYRDFALGKEVGEGCSRKYLEDMYGALKTIMDKTERFDVDNDGVIENSGDPDQTYDTWVMTGTSAYCGGLWLGALYAMMVICNELGKETDKQKYLDLLKRGSESFDKKLWNGSFYSFDVRNPKVIMADQLCAHWYLNLCGFDSHQIFPKDKVTSALKVIYNNNVKSHCNGELGAVNGFVIGHGIDDYTIQSEEVWTGVTYGLAAAMIIEGMFEEAWQTAGGMSNALTYRLGLAFQTPEALFAHKVYRSLSYMRPLSIWAMQLAWEQYRNKKKEFR